MEIFKGCIINIIATIWLQKSARIFVLGNYLSLEAHFSSVCAFKITCTSRNKQCPGTNICSLFPPNRCLYLCFFETVNTVSMVPRDCCTYVIKRVLNQSERVYYSICIIIYSKTMSSSIVLFVERESTDNLRCF